VADETDFIDLYGKLRLEPGCTLAEFKQAYRRHVAAWHPDRRRSGRADAIAAARLQRLTAQYSAAMEFHRRHGRLPGAPLGPRVAVVPQDTDAGELAEIPETTPEPAAWSGHANEASRIEEPPARTHATRWWLLAAAVVIAVAAWSLIPATDEPEASTDDEPAAAATPSHHVAPSASFGLGSSESEVLAIEGEPMGRTDDRWEYGPSWVRFENDQVVDWYSSPLRGLHVTTPHPQR
jgi:hypothetical protein